MLRLRHIIPVTAVLLVAASLRVLANPSGPAAQQRPLKRVSVQLG